MSVQISTFPTELVVHPTGVPDYGWSCRVSLGDGNYLYLTDEQADSLAEQLWNRNLSQREAA